MSDNVKGFQVREGRYLRLSFLLQGEALVMPPGLGQEKPDALCTHPALFTHKQAEAARCFLWETAAESDRLYQESGTVFNMRSCAVVVSTANLREDNVSSRAHRLAQEVF